jgi:metal-dependent hydrolase (beta-lactamase superfamily II)
LLNVTPKPEEEEVTGTATLHAVDALDVHVLVDNVTDSLSTVPTGVTQEWGCLNAGGDLVMSGEALCCAAFGLSFAQSLTSAGAAVINSPESRLLLEDRFYLSGEIPRVTPFERGMLNHVKRSEDGVSWEPDPWIMDERYVAAHVRDKGIIVFTGCSHAGLINVLRDASQVFEGRPLYAVMGGFHLSGPGPESIIADTVNAIQGFGLKYIIPGHCTGWRAVSALASIFADDVLVPCAVGRKFSF